MKKDSNFYVIIPWSEFHKLQTTPAIVYPTLAKAKRDAEAVDDIIACSSKEQAKRLALAYNRYADACYRPNQTPDERSESALVKKESLEIMNSIIFKGAEKEYKVICQSCGSICIPQSDEILGGRDDLFACPVCKNRWQEVDETSLPCQLEQRRSRKAPRREK